ncbi:nitrogen assimilation response regulatory protein [Alcanivorax hongdengensis A-11-3]|uniref:Nitrogen assimilation response regulatory protein n=2 Tax=Alcanivorax hongdengensis TaxID=519051 RepID=L0WAA0_9GAMM|nr:nitrogen assimilation response regulatory protein [Alcanivorax hongdengensis A-11-3]
MLFYDDVIFKNNDLDALPAGTAVAPVNANTMMDASDPMALKIMLVDDQPPRAAMLERALTDEGHEILCRLTSAAGLAEKVHASNPDVVIVDMDAPDRDTLESMALIQRDMPRPMVMFCSQDDEDLIVAALRAGVSAYVAGETDLARVRGVMRVATARFREYQALREELEQTREALAERKIIERAKGLLMQRRRLNEQDAYSTLRRQAMNTGQPLIQVARAVLDYAEILKAQG